MNPLCLLTVAKKHLNSQSKHVEVTKPQWEKKGRCTRHWNPTAEGVFTEEPHQYAVGLPHKRKQKTHELPVGLRVNSKVGWLTPCRSERVFALAACHKETAWRCAFLMLIIHGGADLPSKSKPGSRLKVALQQVGLKSMCHPPLRPPPPLGLSL